jgi:hypothetical protein
MEGGSAENSGSGFLLAEVQKMQEQFSVRTSLYIAAWVFPTQAAYSTSLNIAACAFPTQAAYSTSLNIAACAFPTQAAYSTSLYIKKPASAFAKAGCLALAVFLTRPQADYQIGAMRETLKNMAVGVNRDRRSAHRVAPRSHL